MNKYVYEFWNDMQTPCMYLFADWADVLAIYAGKYIILMHTKITQHKWIHACLRVTNQPDHIFQVKTCMYRA